MKFLKAILSTVSLALVLFLTVPATWAQSSDNQSNQLICGPRDAAVAELTGDFGEHVIGRGLSQDGQAMLEILKSDSGSWTIIVTDVNGVSCVLANGQVWVQPRTQSQGYVNAQTKK